MWGVGVDVAVGGFAVTASAIVSIQNIISLKRLSSVVSGVGMHRARLVLAYHGSHVEGNRVTKCASARRFPGNPAIGIRPKPGNSGLRDGAEGSARAPRFPTVHTAMGTRNNPPPR